MQRKTERRFLSRVAVPVVAVLALGACISPGAKDRARDIAVSNLVRSREAAVECFENFLAAYPGDQDFVTYVGEIDGPRCGNPAILNLTEDELAHYDGWRGEPRPFKPGDQDTWFTSASQEGDIAEVAVTTVGAGTVASNPSVPFRATVATCWTLIVDVPRRTAEAVDEGHCHEAVMWPDTEVMDWDHALEDHEHDDFAG